jgi:hypothetical protein
MNSGLRLLVLFVVLVGAFFFACKRSTAAQEPQDVKLPDRLVSVKFEFHETLVDAAGIKPSVTRPKGSVEMPLTEITASITISVFNPATKEMEPVTYAADEVAALLRAIGEKKWLEVNPPPLPQNRRSVREPSKVIATSTP